MEPGTTPPGEMTNAQLRQEYKALATHVSEIEGRRKALRTEYDRRLDRTAMQTKIDALTPGQREAARQILCDT